MFKKDYKAIAYTCGAVTAACALPAAADIAIGHEIEVSKADSGYGPVMITPDGSDTIKNTLTVLFLWTQGDKVVLRWDGVSDWQIVNGFRPYMDTGWKNQSDWTNVHLGDAVITYDNPGAVAEPAIGDKILGANGSYGICVYKTATTAVLKKLVCVGATIFANNETISGDRSGFTALVNMGSGLKNVDSYIYHGWGKSITDIEHDLCICSSVAEANIITLDKHIHYNGGWAGMQGMGVDLNNIKIQTLTTGFYLSADDGTVSGAIDAEDYYFKLIIKL